MYFNECFDEVCASDAPPEINDEGELWTSYNSKLDDFATLKNIITIDNPYIDIEKEPGIVDWSSVAVDTPVIVWENGRIDTHKRHFAKYENGKVYVYRFGNTSWTSNDDVRCWDNVHIANVNKE